MTVRLRACLSLSALTLSLAGCQVPTGGGASGMQALPGGSFDVAGAVIEEPGMFRIEGGQNFTTPFSVDCTQLDASVNGWTAALNAGAHRVLITLPGQPRPFGGVLALCKIDSSATGPASRSYQLTIPNDRVAEAADGRISTVAEKVSDNRARPINFAALLVHPPGAPAQPQGPITEDYAWMIWLSDRPDVLGVNFAPAAPPPSAAPAATSAAPKMVKGATYTVASATTLRSGASRASAAVEPLKAGDTVTANGSRKNGYWSVTASDGKTGWVGPKALSAQ